MGTCGDAKKEELEAFCEEVVGAANVERVAINVGARAVMEEGRSNW